MNNKLLITGFGCLGLGVLSGIGWFFFAKNSMDGLGFIAASILVITGSALILLRAVGGRLR